MKYIVKSESCEALATWKAELEKASDPNLGYKHPGFPRQQVKEALLKDQGYLCAYTMQRITLDSCHIEHIKPQQRCREEDRACEEKGVPIHLEEIAWDNLLACYPAPLKKGETEPGYGARQRGNWWSEDEFLSPLDPDCEVRIRYSHDGEIDEANDSFSDARTTIEKMKLMHGTLKENRERAIRQMGFHPLSEEPMPLEDAKEFVENKWKERLEAGFFEFCVALRDAAREYLRSVERQRELSSAQVD